jgi:hypothetical protein
MFREEAKDRGVGDFKHLRDGQRWRVRKIGGIESPLTIVGFLSGRSGAT